MASSPSPSKENQCSDVVTDAANLWKNKDISCEHVDDDDEDADVDFNPFLKEAPSLEASVSISSEIEEFDADVVDSGENHPPVVNVRNAPDELQDDTAGNVDHGQQTVMQSNIATVTTTDATAGSDDEDAIWRRTRARYSLVGSTLDELETFLQETDDEDDMHHNIDDQEEYRKFLAAVLQDGDSNSNGAQDHEIIDDDEDNDADFELELEEALGSDVDENLQTQEQHEHEHVGRRPETRQKKRQKTNHRQDKFSGKTNRPLRPLVPYAPIAPYASPVVPYPPNSYMIQTTSYTKNDYISAFTPHQIGQLHCLMYEHVQLLVQVFSLSVLEPSRHHIATQVHKLLSEMLHKRDQIVASQRAPYPPFCFNTQYIQSTVNLSENSNMNGSFWAPFVSNNVLSVIDVAPLNLVRTYMDDVSIAVREHQKRQLEVAYDAAVNKECLFPFDSSVEPDTTTSDQKSKSKKTIAAGLVERSKKQSIALVPKEIAKLALRFFPLFNPALFPHKPPPVSVANRVLFTDSEDGLLARGIMKYNTDWKEIQKNYLPCKTPHQIFVRQKNRACSKAPENPIKAVRRMKTSPLTPQEKARIEEGLKIYKLDWMAVWQYMVPHRDPSLLPRQWRTAVGSQKSYKGDEQTKARRRIYESKRRKSKLEGSTLLQSQNRQGWSTEEDANALPGFPRCRTMSDKENCSTGNVGENNSGDDGENNEDEAYVHEAFFSDWRPNYSNSGENQPVELFTQNRIVNTQFPAKIIRSSRQVKLAPDLPPVNLPPTVRVMSQSAFTKYQDEACNKVRQNVGLPLSQPRIGQLDERKSVTCNTAVEKSDSDLQMHPLLFQDPEDGRSLPYYPLNGSAGSSSSFDFFPNNPPQLNLNLFRHSQQAKHTLNFFNNSLKSKESSGVDFHPLLQRTDDGNGGTPLIQRIVADSAPPHQTVVPPSPNELDLDIGLSSNARKARVENGRDPDSGGGSTGVRNDEIVMEQEELSDSEDEEIAESVEFECEEMTDSEGESGSDSGHVENMQNEDVEDGSDEDEARLQETWKSDEPTSLFGLSLNPKLAVRRNSRSLKNTTSSSQPQLEAAKKPRKRADPK